MAEFEKAMREGRPCVRFLEAAAPARLDEWKRLAGISCPEAQVLYGECLALGIVANQDYAQARTWFGKAADAGNTTAMICLGSLHQNGQVQPDPDETVAQDLPDLKPAIDKLVAHVPIAQQQTLQLRGQLQQTLKRLHENTDAKDWQGRLLLSELIQSGDPVALNDLIADLEGKRDKPSINLVRDRATTALVVADMETARDRLRDVLRDTDNDMLATEQLGFVYTQLGNLGKARSQYKTLLDVAGQEETWRGLAMEGLAQVARQNDEIDKAQELLNDALAVHRGLAHLADEARALRSLADVVRTRGQITQAKDLLGEALEINRKLGLLDAQSETLAQLSKIHEDLKDLATAKLLLEQSLEINRQIGHLRGQLSDLRNLARICQILNESDVAGNLVAQAAGVEKLLPRWEMSTDIGNNTSIEAKADAGGGTISLKSSGTGQDLVDAFSAAWRDTGTKKQRAILSLTVNALDQAGAARRDRHFAMAERYLLRARDHFRSLEDIPDEVKSPVEEGLERDIASLSRDAKQAARTLANYVQAMHWYRKAADAGNPSAMYNVGCLYAKGLGTTQDYGEALKWYRKAADAGDANAMLKIGIFHDEGHGVRQDDVQAARWYRKAADAGNPSAMFNVGFLYAQGLGINQDYGEAMKWYRKAAAAGDESALNNIGHLYMNGLGVSRDYVEAMKWFRKSAAAGDTKAMYNIGYLYTNGGWGVSRDYGEAMKWYRKAADAGDENPMNNIGYLYEKGLGVSQDYGEAMKWYRKAAAAGDGLAMSNIGKLYEKGVGVARDSAEAAKWFRKAADAGNEDAKKRLRDKGESP